PEAQLAIFLGDPEETLSGVEPHGHARVEVDPGVVVLADEFAGRAGGRIDLEDELVLLVARLDDDGGRGVFRPFDDGEVWILFRVPFDGSRLRRLAAAGADDIEAHLGVVGSGARVAP